jgi:hypothetical protein
MGADKIIVEKKRATIAGTQTLCGSIASLAECVQNMRQALLDGETKKCNEKNSDENDKNKFIVESIEAATLHPASGRFFNFFKLKVVKTPWLAIEWNEKYNLDKRNEYNYTRKRKLYLSKDYRTSYV